MDKLNTLFDTRLISYGEHVITIGQVTLVILMILTGLLFTRWMVNFTARWMQVRQINEDLIHLFKRGILVVAIAVLLLTGLDLLNIPLTAFAFVSGAIAIGVGFGAQNIINNFISGWILMWERPIRIRDFIEIGDVKGTIESIDTRSTRIRRTDGVHLLVPNSFLLENIIVNWTLVDRLTRGTIRVGVAYGSPTDQVAGLLLRATSEHDSILKEPEAAVLFSDFGDSALIFDLYFWINASSERDSRRVASDLRFIIDKLFRENEVVISFPQRDIHLDGELKISNEQ